MAVNGVLQWARTALRQLALLYWAGLRGHGGLASRAPLPVSAPHPEISVALRRLARAAFLVGLLAFLAATLVVAFMAFVIMPAMARDLGIDFNGLKLMGYVVLMVALYALGLLSWTALVVVPLDGAYARAIAGARPGRASLAGVGAFGVVGAMAGPAAFVSGFFVVHEFWLILLGLVAAMMSPSLLRSGVALLRAASS